MHDAEGADQLLAINACVLQLIKYTDYRRQVFKQCYERLWTLNQLRQLLEAGFQALL